MASDGTRVNNGKFHSLMRPPGNIPENFAQFMSISNGDVSDCQVFLVVGKEFTVFLKDKLDDQGEIDEVRTSRLVLVVHNRQRFDVTF